MHDPAPANISSAGKSAPWFYLFMAALALTAWLTTSLRETEVKLSRTAERLARTESYLQRSQSEVRELKKSVDEVKKMVGSLAGEDEEDAWLDEEALDDESGGEDELYLASENLASL